MPVVIEGHPDREPGNTGGCDAVIARGGVLWAVEHTTIHTQAKKPVLIKQLNIARPIIAGVVQQAYPRSIVRVGLPVVETLALKRIPAIAEEAAKATVAALKGARLGERVRFGVQGLHDDVFAERFLEPVPEAFCAVSPAVWGRDEDEFTIDDFCRAFLEKRKQAERCDKPVILLLETTELVHLPGAITLYERAAARESVHPFRDIFIGTGLFDPPFIIPLKLGDRSPIRQPELGLFIGYRFDPS